MGVVIDHNLKWNDPIDHIINLLPEIFIYYEGYLGSSLEMLDWHSISLILHLILTTVPVVYYGIPVVLVH